MFFLYLLQNSKCLWLKIVREKGLRASIKHTFKGIKAMADGSDSLKIVSAESDEIPLFENSDFITAELTPNELRCTYGACPAVFKTHQGKLVIIGKKPTLEIFETIENKIGNDEWAIVIDPTLLSNL